MYPPLSRSFFNNGHPLCVDTHKHAHTHTKKQTHVCVLWAEKSGKKNIEWERERERRGRQIDPLCIGLLDATSLTILQLYTPIVHPQTHTRTHRASVAPFKERKEGGGQLQSIFPLKLAPSFAYICTLFVYNYYFYNYFYVYYYYFYFRGGHHMADKRFFSMTSLKH